MVLVVNSKSPWKSDWAIEADRQEKVRKGLVRLVFVGTPDHARDWATDPAVRRRAMPQIKVVRLRPWTRSFLGSQVDALQLNHDLVDRILQATGGWNEVVGPLIEKISEKPDNAIALIAEAADKALADAQLTTDLGVPADLLAFFRELATYAEGSKITVTDFQTLCTWEGRTFDPKTVGVYGHLMGRSHSRRARDLSANNAKSSSIHWRWPP